MVEQQDLVIETKNEFSKHTYTIIIQHSHTQYYDVKDLHLKKHWTEQRSNVSQYLSILRDNGFVNVSNYGECKKKTKKSIFILEGEKNYFLPDVVVINDFSLFGNINKVLDRVNFSDMANIMLCHDNLCQKDRGNVRLDAGFVAQSCTNKDVIPGMNLPQFSTRTNRINGVNDGDNFTKSIISAGCRIAEISDIVQTGNCQRFQDFARKELFVSNTHHYEECQDDMKPFFRFEGVSIGLCGMLKKGVVYNVTPHEDKMNDPNDSVGNYNHNCCINRTVNVTVMGGFQSSVRVAINIYGKKCCYDTLKRKEKYDKIGEIIHRWRKRRAENFCPTGDIWHFLEFERNFTWKAVQPIGNKDLYYSFFVHSLIKFGEENCFNRTFLLEAVYAMSFTPSPMGWKRGMKWALEMTKKNGVNPIVNFILITVERKGCVSFGKWRRRQVSHGKFITYYQLFQSLKNMEDIISFANTENDSTKVIRRLSSRVELGGMHGVGNLIGQEILNVLTKVGIIHNLHHAKNGEICRGTETCRRLENLDIKTDANRKEMIHYLSFNLGIDRDKIENVTCESLRLEFGSNHNSYDTIFRGQFFFEIEEGLLWATNCCGTKFNVPWPRWTVCITSISNYINWRTGWDDSLNKDYLFLTKK